MKKKPKKRVEHKPAPVEEPKPYWPKPGEMVEIVKCSVFWGPGKIGLVLNPESGGWAVKVNFKDTFAGQTSATDHIIWAEIVKPYTEPKKP